MAQKINSTIFKNFFNSEKTGGILLMICVIISLVIANSNAAKPFEQLLNYNIGFNIGSTWINYSISLWINDGLMAVFFFW